MYRLECKCYADMDEHALNELGRFRYRVFIENLKWSFSEACKTANVEFDEFDVPGTIFVIAYDLDGSVIGCARLLPTTHPFLLGEVFPNLCSEPIPRNTETWEISRYAALDSSAGNLGINLFKTAICVASAQGARTVIAVTNCALERYFRRQRVVFERMGPVLKNLKENLVALKFPAHQFSIYQKTLQVPVIAQKPAGQHIVYMH